MPFADGDIPVSRSVLPEGEAGVDATVEKMVEMAKGVYGARSAKIRALAINIVNQAKVADKDYFGMIQAIHNWVRDHIRYVRDPIGQETLSYPEETAFNSKGEDCLDGDTRLLTPVGYKAIRDVREGDVIQGRLGWTKVLRWFDKGELPTYRVLLDNGAEFIATGEHRCFLLDGSEKNVSQLATDDALLGPSTIVLPEEDEFLTDDDYHFVGLYLADGWCTDSKTCIAGKDGFAKEAQKLWVQAWAEEKGWRTNWQKRYITVYIPKEHPLYEMLHDGKLAPDKSIPDVIWTHLTVAKAARLHEGLMADCFFPLKSQRTIGAEKNRVKQQRSGACYSTTSHELAEQLRLLYRIVHGVSVRDTLVVNHGGLGTHPIHRIYPRFFQKKPARVESVEADDVRHVFDLTTEDHGIYLPDADVVVHNCDGKSTLEMALLGSIGISSYPVVVGMQPGRYSHVYVHVIVPPGTGRYAGQTIAADPIMREWPLGKEVSAYKVKAKKLYSELSGLGMTLGSYATGPSYLDHQNVDSVAPALRSKLTDTGSRGRIMNTAEVVRPWDDLDDMFVRGGSPLSAFQHARKQDLYSLGPITARGAQRHTSFLQDIKPRQLHERRVGPKIVTVKNQRAAAPRQDVVTVRELKGLGDYLAAIEPVVRQAAARQTVTGTNDILFKAAAAVAFANQRARQATKHSARVRYAAGMFGLGAEVTSSDLDLAGAIANLANAVADKAARLAKLSTGGAPERERVLRQVLHKLTRADALLNITSVVVSQVPGNGAFPAQGAAKRVATMAEMAHDPDLTHMSNSVERAANESAENAAPRSPIRTPMAAGSVVRDRNGDTVYDDESGAAGLGFSFRKTFKKIKKTADKVVPEAHLLKLTQKAIGKVAVKSPLLKPLAKKLAKVAVVRQALGLKRPGGRPSVSVGANGQPVYQDANGNVITQAQYNALVATMNAEQANYDSAIAKLQASSQNGQKPALTSAEITVLQKYDPANYAAYQQMMTASSETIQPTIQTQTTGAATSTPSSPMYAGSGGSGYSSGSSMPVPQSSMPVDSFGPDQMGPAVDQSGAPSGESASDTQVTATGYDDPSGDASEGSLYASGGGEGDEGGEDEGAESVDENGNPIDTPALDTAAPATAPAASSLPVLALLGGAAWWFLGKKH